MRRSLPLLFALTLSFTACATVDHGPMQRIRVGSWPAGATVTLDDCGAGSTARSRTPGSVWVNRRATRCTLTFSAIGFQPETFFLHRAISDATTKNVRILDGICGSDGKNCNSLSDLVAVTAFSAAVVGTGVGVDALSGALFEQQPRQLVVELCPDEWRTRTTTP